MIYEGTNEIQAIDLLVRKVIPDGGAGLLAMLQGLGEGLDAEAPLQARLIRQIDALRGLTIDLAAAAKTDPQLPFWVADDYLRLVALTLLAWAWLKIEEVASLQAPGADPARWAEPAAALGHWVLPEFEMRRNIIRARLGL